jgi:hypothetical protein
MYILAFRSETGPTSDQHFLPASYIGRFSLAINGAWRERPIWVQRVGRPPFAASAEYVARARRFYDREKPAPGQRGSVDEGWRYEPRLPEALNALADPRSDFAGRLWARVLVPFVSALLIRGVDFKARYESRIPGFTGPASDGTRGIDIGSWHDNTITSGQIEWQRLLAPIMVAKWTVLDGSGAPVLATSDVAHCLMGNPDMSPGASYAIPIDTSTILVLERRSVRRLLDWDGSRWIAPIDHVHVSDDELINCRPGIKHGAFKEVYGPTRESVEFPSSEFAPRAVRIGADLLMPAKRGRALLPYIEDYFRLLTILESDPLRAMQWDGLPDWKIVAAS